MSGPVCESCDELLLFVENVDTGKRLPLVRKPNRVRVEDLKPGMVVVSPSRRKGRVLSLAVIEAEVDRLREACDEERVHTTHFGDCPDAARFRR